MIGAFVGLKSLVVGLFVAVFLGVVVGLAARHLGRSQKGQPMPFGPFLAAGGLVGLFFGSQLSAFYARLVGLN
jgi:prepilin signal peptidase PulO-like enzyme (type II secretory pathway)